MLRHGKVVVLKINAEQMSKDGINFYQADNSVWLCDLLTLNISNNYY